MAEKPVKRIRFAIYTRYSSEMQTEMSLEAQEKRCREAIVGDKHNGVVVQVYSDSAKSGWSPDRPGLKALQRDAAKGKFDAIMMWKFDRLARDHVHVTALKTLLRREYGVKLYCVEGASSDEDDTATTWMMEQVFAVFSAFYSKNLSNETKRGKRQRAENGDYNGSIPPFGYELLKKKDAKADGRPAGLYVIAEQATIVKQAFERYVTGRYSDAEIAQWMNSQPVVQEVRKDRQPFNKESVRDLLQNRTYVGEVSYTDTQYRKSLGSGKKSTRGRKAWFDGKHEAIISVELFEHALEVRRNRANHRLPPSTTNTYVLKDRVYCARCVSTKPRNLVDHRYGKMRAKWDKRRSDGEFRCISRDRGYTPCPQKTVAEQTINDQVVSALKSLEIPVGYRDRVEAAVKARVEHDATVERIESITAEIERVDLRWDKGFFKNPADYIDKRRALQRELESLRPIDYHDLMEAADLIENFESYWDQCEQFDNPAEARQQLLAKIIDRVFVYDDQVIGIALHGDFNVILDQATMLPSEVFDSLKGALGAPLDESKSGNITMNVSAHCGSDGI